MTVIVVVELGAGGRNQIDKNFREKPVWWGFQRGTSLFRIHRETSKDFREKPVW